MAEPRPRTIFTRERVKVYSSAFLLLGIVSFLAATLIGDFPTVLGGQPFLPDYLAHWTGGRLLRDGLADQLYDPSVQAQLQHATIPGYQGLSWFVSPPFAALMYLPLALVPYGPSALVWLVITIALLALAIRLALPLIHGDIKGEGRLVTLAFLATPAVLEVVGGGQDSVIVLVIYVVAIRLLLSDHEVAAGAILGLALFKPQLVCLIPVLFVVRHQWRALAAFSGVAFVLALVSWLLVGMQGINAWVDALRSPLYTEMVQEGQTWKMQAGSALLTDLIGAHWLAYGYLLIGAAVLCVVLARTARDIQADWALVLLFTVSCSPHVVIYDMVILLPALIWLFSTRNSDLLRWVALAAFALQWTASIRHALIDNQSGVWSPVDSPWTAIPITILCVLAIRMRMAPHATERAALL